MPRTCSVCKCEGHTKRSCPTLLGDFYTEDVLKKRWNMFMNHVNDINELLKEHPNVKIRMPNMPEDISENIIKFILRNKLRDKTTTWNTPSGDLKSKVYGKQECKCFKSDGPLTFGPTENWDVLYILDARNFRNLVFWRVNLPNTAEEWSSLKLSKASTFADCCNQGKRPHITWNALFPQIENHADRVYEGTFHSIFSTMF